MKHTTLFLISICLMLFFFFGQAQNATYLQYKYIENKKGKQVENGGIEFFIAGNLLRAKKTYQKYPMPQKTFDQTNKVVVFDFQEQKEYVIEELDSIYTVNTKLVSTGDKETVSGYTCDKYTADATWSIGGVGMMGAQTSNTPYSFIVWITNDIAADESNSLYLSSCLTGNVAKFTYKGVIVKIESSSKHGSGATVLEPKTINTLKGDGYVMPWKSSQPYTALLPESAGTREGYIPGLIYTDEYFPDYFKRMRSLLTKITGIEKPKFAKRPLSIAVQ